MENKCFQCGKVTETESCDKCEREFCSECLTYYGSEEELAFCQQCDEE